ncbi:MAG UNVERIFIED_CONTAM: hypothetical protein LVR18_43015 [Planctomycetaceae bacterium]
MKLRSRRQWLAGARALGGSLLRLPPGQPGVQALSARLLVQSDSAMAWNDEQRPVLPLLCDQSQATLTLQTAATRVGVQIIPAASSSKTAAADGSAVPADPAALTAALLSASCDYSVLITVLEGSVAPAVSDRRAFVFGCRNAGGVAGAGWQRDWRFAAVGVDASHDSGLDADAGD